MPVMLEAKIPLSRFTVRDLLALEVGKTIQSDWATTEDVPLRIGHLQLCWAEFEVVEDRIALRMTRLA
jgi:flagellar motor switch protein FliM